jgi:hypothetical protein
MADYFTLISTQLGIPIWVFLIIIAWEAVWKLIAMWKAAAVQKSLVWFIVLAVFNTIGILPILYIFVFSKMGKKSSKKRKKK